MATSNTVQHIQLLTRFGAGTKTNANSKPLPYHFQVYQWINEPGGRKRGTWIPK